MIQNGREVLGFYKISNSTYCLHIIPKPFGIAFDIRHHLTEVPPQVLEFDFLGSQSGQIIGNDGLSVFVNVLTISIIAGSLSDNPGEASC